MASHRDNNTYQTHHNLTTVDEGASICGYADGGPLKQWFSNAYMWSWPTSDNAQYRQPTLRSHDVCAFLSLWYSGWQPDIEIKHHRHGRPEQAWLTILQREEDQTVIWVGHLNPLLHAGKLFCNWGYIQTKPQIMHQRNTYSQEDQQLHVSATLTAIIWLDRRKYKVMTYNCKVQYQISNFVINSFTKSV